MPSLINIPLFSWASVEIAVTSLKTCPMTSAAFSPTAPWRTDMSGVSTTPHTHKLRIRASVGHWILTFRSLSIYLLSASGIYQRFTVSIGKTYTSRRMGMFSVKFINAGKHSAVFSLILESRAPLFILSIWL